MTEKGPKTSIKSGGGGGVTSIDDYAKDCGEELFTKMHCVLITNP